MHVDPISADGGPFDGLIASGWHTVSLMMRIFVSSFWNQHASLGGLGADKLRWLSPVRPGDTLSARFTVVESRRSKTRPDRGTLHVDVEVFRDDGTLVLTMQTVALLRARPGSV
ncbi:MaoC/PaaZ C-terminal domain-containing protein [Paenarthrobacter sp. NPDC056912]|uniref:MaoC/PaaZ C-terminal domain-containing protein n=1 Tax=Paenarthrobacter sp. NPDC056912 TaxID=3345965 RepID=UPI003671DD6B